MDPQKKAEIQMSTATGLVGQSQFVLEYGTRVLVKGIFLRGTKGCAVRL